MRPWLTIALAVVATAEDEAVAAYVRFARTTLPKLEKAWAAPHRADPVTQSKRMFDAPTIRRIDMLVGRYLDRSDNFAAPDIKPCME